jgi:hypothetical protein
VEWDGAELNKYFVPLFGHFKKKKNKIEGMWWYGLKFILFYSIPPRSIPLFFFQIQTMKHYFISFRSASFRYIPSIQTEPKIM